MPATYPGLFNVVPKNDLLNLWSSDGLDYREVSELLEYDKNELSKLAGVAKSSVRFDAKIPRDLKERLEEIAVIANLVAVYFEGNAEKTALWFRMPSSPKSGLTQVGMRWVPVPISGEMTPRCMSDAAGKSCTPSPSISPVARARAILGNCSFRAFCSSNME